MHLVLKFMVNGVIMERGANAVRSVQKPEVELVRIRNQLMREINAKENQQNCDSVLMKNVLVIYLYNLNSSDYLLELQF